MKKNTPEVLKTGENDDSRSRIEGILSDDITTLDGLAPLAGQVVKYTKNHGRTWRFGRLWDKPERFSDDSYGFAIKDEIQDNLRSRSSITDSSFKEGGCIVRRALPHEYENIRFSYE